MFYIFFVQIIPTNYLNIYMNIKKILSLINKVSKANFHKKRATEW